MNKICFCGIIYDKKIDHPSNDLYYFCCNKCCKPNLGHNINKDPNYKDLKYVNILNSLKNIILSGFNYIISSGKKIYYFIDVEF